MIKSDDEGRYIEWNPEKPFRMSPDAMRALQKATGRTLTDLLQDEDEGVRFQTSVFGELFRDYARAGHLPDAAAIWDEAATIDVAPEMADALAAIVDPTRQGFSTTSPDSAGTGA
jgi:hypothetical protein